MVKFNAKLCLLGVIGLFCSNHSGFGEIVSGGLQNIGNPGPAAVMLNTAYTGMNAMMSQISDYAIQNNKCPPANYFSNQASAGFSLSNGSNCDVIIQFGRNTPGVLQAKTIRVVTNVSGVPINPSDFALRQVITNIDFGSNGTDPSFLLHQAPAFTYSSTLQGTSFGNAASAGLSDVLNDNYQQIASASSTANAPVSGGRNVAATSASIK